jgi:hypothetical protein
MPRGPHGQNRPADVIGNTVLVAKIATSEIEDVTTEDGKNAATVALGYSPAECLGTHMAIITGNPAP